MSRRQCRCLQLFAVGVAILAVGGFAAAQDKASVPVERKDVDRRLYEVLKDVINTGADLYNDDPAKGKFGDPAACYRLYHGALMTVRPFLDHRSELQASIDKGLVNAENDRDNRKRAFTLREVIDEIRAKVKPEDKGKEKEATKPTTLWERLGGEKGVTQIVDDLVASASADAKVNFFRDDKFKDKVNVPKLKKLLVEQISSVAGGPLKYSGREMKAVHAGMGITTAEFAALTGHLKKALEKNGVKPNDVDLVMMVVNGTRGEIVEEKK